MKHIIFQGPRDSGKTVQAIKLTRILFEAHEKITVDAVGNKNLKKYLTLIHDGIKAIIIEENASLKAIEEIVSYVDGFFFSMDIDYMLIFTTQADCSAADGGKFRVLQCSYNAVREEYLIEPLTVNEKAPGTEPPAAP